jgi:chemotaxis-related protein WspD
MSNPGLQHDSSTPEAGSPGGTSQTLDEIDPCWHKIGVYGQGSCPELEKFVHCRNCPVYSQAGLQLLNRPLPEDYRRQWTAHFARKENHAPPTRISAVVFRIGSEWLALPTQAFQEVAERRVIHSLPHRRDGIVLGLANVRGELLICVSLGRLLGGEKALPRPASSTVYDRLLVIGWENQRLVFPVDEVHGIQRFQSHEMKELPATVAKATPCFTSGVFFFEGRSVGFLDAAPLFEVLNRSLA